MNPHDGNGQSRTSRSRMLTVTQIMERLQCSRSWVTGKLNAGIIPGVFLGGMWRTDEEEFEAYLAENHNSARPAIAKQKVPTATAPVSQLNGGKIAAAWKRRGVNE